MEIAQQRKWSFLEKKRLKALFIWGIAAFFYGYEFFLRASPSVMQSELQQSFLLDAGGLGFIVSLYYWAYASMQVPAGMLIDRFGPRYVLTVAALICALSTVVFGAATIPLLAGAARFMIGFGSAFALIGTFKLAGNYFPSNQFAFLAGFSLTFGTIGAVLAGEPLALLVEEIGWRSSLFFISGVGFLNAILLWVFVKDHPDHDQKKLKKTREASFLAETQLAEVQSESKNAWKTLKYVICNPQSWFIGAFAAFIYIPITCFGELWGVPFIMKACFCDRPTASFTTSLIFVGATVGAPLFGWFSDFLKKRKLPIFIGTFGAFSSISLALYIPYPSLEIMSFLMFILGVCLGSHMILFALIQENNPSNASAIASGFGNFVCMIVPGFFQYMIGVALDLLNQEVIHSGKDAYSLSSFRFALISIPIGLLFAALFLSFARETFAKQAVYKKI